MAKPVSGLCNLDCRYCYYTAKPRELYSNTPQPMMSDEVLESYTRQYMSALPKRAEFGWQGGEPLLAGKDFFRRAIELQKSLALSGQTISNAIQTNGTLLDDEWCELLAEGKFLVGISLDGPAQWHDSFRRDRAGQGSFHRAWAGLEMLRRHGIEHNVLVTLNSANAPHAGDIYRYFTNRGVNYLQFIPILERDEQGRPTDFSCTPQQFGRFMLDVFDLWASRDIGHVSERFIDNVIHHLIYGQAAMCCHATSCANAHVLEFNGDLYACDHFVYKQWLLGNILQTPLTDLLTGDKLSQFAQLKQLPAACRQCPYAPLCNGGCPKHHIPIGTDPARVNYFCEGYKMFFREALDDLREMARHFAQGRTPPLRGAKPQERPSPTAAPSHRPGRNDPCPCGSGRKYKSCCGRR